MPKSSPLPAGANPAKVESFQPAAAGQQFLPKIAPLAAPSWHSVAGLNVRFIPLRKALPAALTMPRLIPELVAYLAKRRFQW